MVVAAYYIAAGGVLGAALGALMARRRGGGAVDMLHYATVLAIFLALVGLFLSVFLGRGAGG